MMMPRVLLASALAAYLSASASALTLANSVASSMVLQRDVVNTALWGLATPGVTVLVTFSTGLAVNSTAADALGVWRVSLPPLIATVIPFTVLFNASDGSNTAISDVVVGDVLLCSGQSNMALSVEMALNASAELAAAGAYGAYVRSLQVPGASSPTPTLDIARATGLWQRASSASLGVSGFAGFSATCWFVGRDLFNALGGAVPVGIIESSVGGTAIRQWAPRAALARCPQPYTAPAPYGTAPYAHSQHWNAMVAGLTTGPTTIASIVWDQAESDSFPQSPPGYYGCQTTAQINAWRSAWRAPALPWVFVHLQPYTGAAYLEQLRAAQLEALTLPAVGVASAVDLGDVASPFGNVHFRDKQTIARRIVGALLALVPDAASSYPPPAFLDSSVFWVSATGAAEVDVVFDAGGTGGASGGALALVPSVCPAAVPVLNCSEFQILGNDTAAYAATASLNGNTLTLSASLPSWVYPVGSSYAWAAWPLASLFADGGPAGALPILPWRQALMLAGPPGPRE